MKVKPLRVLINLFLYFVVRESKYKKLSEISDKGNWKRKGLKCEALNIELDWKELKKYVQEFNKENK